MIARYRHMHSSGRVLWVELVAHIQFDGGSLQRWRAWHAARTAELCAAAEHDEHARPAEQPASSTDTGAGRHQPAGRSRDDLDNTDERESNVALLAVGQPPPNATPAPLSVVGSARDISLEKAVLDEANAEHEGRLVAMATMVASEKALSYACHGTWMFRGLRVMLDAPSTSSCMMTLAAQPCHLIIAELRNPLHLISATIEVMEDAVPAMDVTTRQDFQTICALPTDDGRCGLIPHAHTSSHTLAAGRFAPLQATRPQQCVDSLTTSWMLLGSRQAWSRRAACRLSCGRSCTTSHASTSRSHASRSLHGWHQTSQR